MRDLRIGILLGLAVLLFSNLGQRSVGPDELKSEIEQSAIKFFIENAHPVTGQVLDKAENFAKVPNNNRVASIASTGFALAVITNAAKRGLIDDQFARDYALRAVKFARDRVPRRKGWFLHFHDWETGERRFSSEYSTIDTALFMGGALYAAAVYPDTEIASIVAGLYRDLDFWDMMTDGGNRPEKRTLSMAYVEEYGYTPAQWHMYAEQMLLLILGMGHPTKPLPVEAWLAVERDSMPLPAGEEVMGLEEALFVHQYSQNFLDLRSFNDRGRNHHNNAYRISRYHRDMANKNASFKTLREGFWGYSAGESPKGYEVWSALNFKGTVCLGCAMASYVFMPQEVLGDMVKWRNGPYKDKIWGRYGFTDSLDLDQNWFAANVLGITIGPAYMSLANGSEETSFWRTFMSIPEIRSGMQKAAGSAPNMADAHSRQGVAVSQSF